ncbi:hypothetical protein ACEE13_12310, partial [Staphylococcus simulans]
MISSIILSSIAYTEKITKRIKKRVLMLLTFVSVVVYGISYFVGFIFIYLLYENFLEAVKPIYFFLKIKLGLIWSDYILSSFFVKYYLLKLKSIINIFDSFNHLPLP